jgi:hypothetical protein
VSRRNDVLDSPETLAGYVPRPGDVFVSTYPKSGTNWMLQVVLQLVHGGAAEFGHVHEVVPWPDAGLMPGGGTRHFAVPLEAVPVGNGSPAPGRVIKTHLHAKRLPLDGPARHVVVLRDPKDVFVSCWHFVRDSFLGPAMPSVSSWLELYLEGKTIGGSWTRHTIGFWRARARGHVKVVSFKEMKRDLPGVVRDVAGFLGVPAGEDVVARTCERSSFEAMRRVKERFGMGRRIAWRREGAMIRRGAQGGSSELLTPEQQRAIDDRFRGTLAEHAPDLSYEDFADPALGASRRPRAAPRASGFEKR